eukprot:CAMPEP_0174375300 /NCGR_PEP_ID=MMETSP0811_2-20130205/114083_1 /TAXON_ID=73025 ORGANISM="Eutreptiella gymnastica-like, Strain CCMP1594" /NCGR_SAMPLE_ID=MMETSP0811_2 /ASSEMBLY_ACC=CAM_ASM_000667 /LENGTH=39 /DNA_ID= /DNA_START= /DNA_END= /DNA_ORIENTATION=
MLPLIEDILEQVSSHRDALFTPLPEYREDGAETFFAPVS